MLTQTMWPMLRGWWSWLLLSAALAGASGSKADECLLLISDPPSDGLVTARVDLTAAARWCEKTPVSPAGLRAVTAEGQAVPLQFIPDADFDGSRRATGVIVLRLPDSQTKRLRLEFSAGDATAKQWSGTVTGSSYTVRHDSDRQGGLPSSITFTGSDKTFDKMRWNNRLHHRELGSFVLGKDPGTPIELLSDGPLCSVVRVRGRFVQGGNWPASQPSAVYDWYYFRDRPLVYVAATIRQREPFAWHEVHFLEMDYPREEFPHWAGGEPLQQGTFEDTKKTHSCPTWGLVHDGRNGIGMFQCGQALFYDAGAGTYLQAHGDVAWQEWSDLERRFSAWLWIGADEDPSLAVQRASRDAPVPTQVTVSVTSVRAKIDAAQTNGGASAGWQVDAAEQLESQGRLREALDVVSGRVPAGWTVVSAGDLTMVLERTDDGIRLLNLCDSRNRQRLAGPQPLPLFSLALRHAETSEELRIDGDSGWKVTRVEPLSTAEGVGAVELRWERPADERLGELRVTARAVPETASHTLAWRFSAEGQSAPWSLWRVVFPQAAIPDLGPGGCVLFPKACGEVQRDVWRRAFRFSGTYPSGWTTMQFLAAYRADGQSGLYLAVHDPWGSTKDLLCESRMSDHSVVLKYDHPVADMGRPGNRFELNGQAVWQLLRGDWFDAAVAYRSWVRQQAKWYPRLTAVGRPDTPPWMRELSAWAQVGGPPATVQDRVKQFTDYLGLPVGFHWYNWHEIPFDNDYPHYFPTKPGFTEAVRDLQSSNVFVMPYINGRLWDTRDKGVEDFEFTSVAKAAVSKNEKGEPYTEVYGSKEADGSPVRLGVMCPATPLWQTRVREIVLRLMNECGVKGVYIDQVAAAAPTLCFDASHGHPLGGGHWWTEGYWKLLDEIRAAMPAGAMLTTECNGEPYIQSFDGYLTWHWQYDGQVPAFPAVYGGAIQMFGRSYGGGETKNLALRMKAGQQLVFGEQIGWLNPGLAREPENASFFRDAVRLRHQLRHYFSHGEMARPPQLTGPVPTVRADWQWYGTTWVTTDAVLTGAWRVPSENRIVLILANVSDEPVSTSWDYDLTPYDLDAANVSVCEITPDGPRTAAPSGALPREMAIPPRTVMAWEVRQR